MPKLTLKDGSILEVAANTTCMDAARQISEGLARVALVARLDGEVVDLSAPIARDAVFEVCTFDDKDGKHAFRHTASHILAQAVKRLYPEAKLAIGPAIEHGFYYDFDAKPFTPEDLKNIEAEMKKIVKENIPLERFTLPREEALAFMRERNEPYKVELIEDLPEGETISFYKQGEFTDLCAGAHVPATGKIKAFALTSCTGAYWRGDSNKKMLQRIYGTAFTKKAVTIVDALGNALKGMKGLLSGDEQAIFDGKTSEEVAKEAVEANKKYMEEQGQENNFQNGWLSFWNINIGQKESAEDSGQKEGKAYTDAIIEELEGKKPTVQDIIDTYWQVAGTEGDAEASVNKLIEQMNPTDAEIEEIKERFSQIGADINLIFGTVEENSVTSGSNAGTSFGNGVRAAMGPVVRDAWTYANQINAALASIGSGLGNVPIYGGGYRAAANGGGNLNINLTSNIGLNGRNIARTVDRYQGKIANRLS